MLRPQLSVLLPLCCLPHTLPHLTPPPAVTHGQQPSRDAYPRPDTIPEVQYTGPTLASTSRNLSAVLAQAQECLALLGSSMKSAAAVRQRSRCFFSTLLVSLLVFCCRSSRGNLQSACILNGHCGEVICPKGNGRWGVHLSFLAHDLFF